MDLRRRGRRPASTAGPGAGGRTGARRPRSTPSSGRAAASRPTPRRRTPRQDAGRGERGRAPGRRPGGLTARAAVLGLVVCALVLSLAYPLKEYLGQRGDIATLQQQTQAAQQRVSALEARRRQLADPAYVTAQARKRLRYVLPGESVYVVVTPAPAVPTASAQAPVLPARGNGSWYERLWGTVRAADGAATR